MDAAAAAATTIRINSVLASSATTGRMAVTTNLIQPSWSSTRSETVALQACARSSCSSFSSHHKFPFPNSTNNTLFLTLFSMKPGIGSNNATNKNHAIELDSNSTSQHLATPLPNEPLTSKNCKGLVFDLGPKNSWDDGEIGSPIVKRYIGDNEERWYMWYHGRSERSTCDSIGLVVSSNGTHWTRETTNSGLVMKCNKNWWSFDTESIRPCEMVVMSSPMYSAVYWLYYTGYSSEEVDLTVNSIQNPERVDDEGKVYKSLPGLACSQDGRHWARIEGDIHSGALLDVGTGREWDSLFIAAPHVVVHSSEDLRMYYYSFDAEKEHFGIGLARSRDGIRWVKMGKIMGGGESGCFDEFGIKNACVVKNHKQGNYLMAYEGVGADGRRSIGLATSPDGLKNWRRVEKDPIIKPSAGDGWDNYRVGSPCVVPMDGNLEEWRVYYVGVGHGGRTGIGMAVSQGTDITTLRRWTGSLQIFDIFTNLLYRIRSSFPCCSLAMHFEQVPTTVKPLVSTE